jgi:hypothetical protein
MLVAPVLQICWWVYMHETMLKKLRKHHHSLVELQGVLDNLPGKSGLIKEAAFRQFCDAIDAARSDLPAFTMPFRPERYYLGSGFYDVSALKTYIALIIASIQCELDVTVNAPVTQRREFLFVRDVELRRLIERDYVELQKVFITGCYKSTIILAGGCIEAILLDLLMSNDAAARASAAAPRNHDMTRWDLSDLIKVAVDLELVGQGLDKLSHSVREYRNLVHPGNELRSRLAFDAEEARIAIEILNMVHREHA